MSQLPHPVSPGSQCFHRSFFFSNELCQLHDKHSNKMCYIFYTNSGKTQNKNRKMPEYCPAQYIHKKITQHLAANSTQTSFFLSIYTKILCSTVTWHSYMPSHILSNFFNLLQGIVVKPTKIFWHCIMFYLQYKISVQPIIIYFHEGTKPFSCPLPPHLPRCINENWEYLFKWGLKNKISSRGFHVYIVPFFFSKSKLCFSNHKVRLFQIIISHLFSSTKEIIAARTDPIC